MTSVRKLVLLSLFLLHFACEEPTPPKTEKNPQEDPPKIVQEITVSPDSVSDANAAQTNETVDKPEIQIEMVETEDGVQTIQETETQPNKAKSEKPENESKSKSSKLKKNKTQKRRKKRWRGSESYSPKSYSYSSQSKKSNILFYRLTDPSFIVDDVANNLRVVLLVENDKPILKDKTKGEGLARTKLIQALKARLDDPELEDVNFYLSDCEFIAHLCEELNIQRVVNQVVYLTNYTITPIRLDYLDVEEVLFERLFNTLRPFENIEYLNSYIETSDHKNIVLFNFREPISEEDLKTKKKKPEIRRALKLIRQCRRNCFNHMTYVFLKNPDEFMRQETKRGKVFLVHQGEFLESPFDLESKTKTNLKLGLEFLKNEGLEDVITHNSRNYFKIYHNDYKAILLLVTQETDQALLKQVKREFLKTARKHREFRKDYADRYIFVSSNLLTEEQSSSKMIRHVIGNQSNPFEIYLLNRSQEENFDNFRLTEAFSDVASFLNNLPYKLEKYHKILQKKQSLDEQKQIAELTDEENYFFEGAKKYYEEWMYLNSALAHYEVGIQDGFDRLNERSIFGKKREKGVNWRFYQWTRHGRTQKEIFQIGG